jgi:hypothetical protein
MPWIVVAAVVFFLVVGQGDPLDGAATVLNEIVRGARLTHAPADAEGLVEADPEELATQAGASSTEAYAGARMIASENPHQDNTTKAAIAHCLINEAARRGESITRLLTRAKNPTNDGHFGTQKDLDPSSANFNGSDRYASTRTDPYQGELDIMEGCLDGSIPDLTNGCTNFDEPGGEKNPDKVAANRVSSGLVAVDVQGADAALRFWRPA